MNLEDSGSIMHNFYWFVYMYEEAVLLIPKISDLRFLKDLHVLVYLKQNLNIFRKWLSLSATKIL